MLKISPIVLFTYNRPWHTKQVLDSLSVNDEAKVSTLYIYCDGAKENATPKEIEDINEVKSLAYKENRFKQVIVKEQVKNKGLANSIIDGVSEIINEHGKIIVLEDDIVAGKYFLKFMNEGLNEYEKEYHVFGISGYKYPSIGEIKDSTYFLPISSSWGYATWVDRWNIVNFNGIELLEIINQNELKSDLNFGGYNFYEMLEDQIVGKNDSWAIRFYASMFLANCFFLYPNASLIENIGFDNSGTHCGIDDYYKHSKITKEIIEVKKLTNSLNNELVDQVKESFKLRNVNTISEMKSEVNKQNWIKTGKLIIKRILGI